MSGHKHSKHISRNNSGVHRFTRLTVTDLIQTMCTSTVGNREINLQRGMVTATKMYLKREVTLALLCLFHLVQCIKCWQFFSGVEF